MTLDEFTVALRDDTFYYGVPTEGHRDCWQQVALRPDSEMQPQQITRSDLGAACEYCAACGKPLIRNA